MPSTTKDQRKGSKPPKHWTQNVQDSAVSRAVDGRLHFALKGGAENGQFVYISDIKHDKIIIRSGKLHVEEIILEINGTKVAGFTLWDIHTLLRDFRDQLLHLKTVKAGQPLTKDLRRYLNTRFQKDSVDHELQQTIRGNLYYRTVPCTTRPPREGELDGVDYKFLSVNEFMALEKSGHLLESGIFDGNHYGTPKPPKEPPPESPPQSPPHSPMDDGPHLPVEDMNETQNDSRSIIRPGATPSSAGKRQRNKSNIDATTLNSKPVDDEEEERRLKIQQLEDKYGVLPSNWEISFTEDGDLYYIDHEREITQWNDPRDDSKEAEEENSSKKSEEGSESKELPYGWERIDDPQYGTYFIDHVNRKTQYESPLKDFKENGEKGSKEVSEKIEASKEAVEESSKRPENGGVLTTTEKDWHHLFTDDPDKLEGQRLKTSLFKSRQGFGFTIIGGDEADEFLQIKSILPDGPAFEDGKLKTGDVLIFVNEKKVLGSTHQDVVSLFQTITPGEKVTLEVCRGYPLPFDPSDPNTNIVTTYAVEPPKTPNHSQKLSEEKSPLPDRRNGRSGSMENFHNHHSGSDGDSPSYHGPGDSKRHGPRKRREDNHLKNSHAKSLPDLTRQVQTDIDHRAKTPTPSMNLHYPDNGSAPHFAKPETIVVEFEKGPDGFGFTVADSPYGQKIKQILVPQRCQGLQEEDILVEINNRNIQSLPHKEVVNCLKECPQGAKARIAVLRGGYIKSSKNKSRSPPKSQKDRGPHSPDGFKYPDERGDHRQAPSDRRGHRYQNGREPFQRDAQRRRSEPAPRVQNDNYRSGGYRPSQGRENSHYDKLPNHVPPNRVNSFDGVNDRQRGRPAPRDVHGSRPEVDRHSVGGESLDSHQRRLMYQDRAQPPYLNDHLYRPDDRSIRPLSRRQVSPMSRDAQSHFIESTIFLKKGENGFGFRIVGGTEEGTQVSVANIVPGGAADLDGRLQSGDQILYIDGQSVTGASHEKVVSLMSNAGHIGRVSLGIRRIVPLAPRESSSPTHSRSSQSTIISSPVDARSTEVVLTRHESEGFGFVVLSSQMKSGTTIGRITKGSPADRNGWLKVGDHIIAINGIDITSMPHKDIVNLIKDTGLTVSLTVGAREGDPGTRSPQLKGDRDFLNAQAMPAQVKGTEATLSMVNQSPRQSTPLNQKPTDPIYAQSSKMKPYPTKQNDQIPGSPHRLGPQHTGQRGNPSSQQTSPRSSSGVPGSYPRPPYEKDTRGPASMELPPYSRPPQPPQQTLDRTLQRGEPPRRDPAPVTHTDGPSRNMDPRLDPRMDPRRAQDPRSATLSRIPNRYPQNKENSFRPPERANQGDLPMNRAPPGQRVPPRGPQGPPINPRQPYQREGDVGQVYSVELERGPTGFGFSLRGGKEYNTPFYVLRMAESGPAMRNGMMKVGDQLLRINNRSTEGMTHKDAIDTIRMGGNRVALTLQRSRNPGNDPRRTAQTPPPMFHNAPLRHSNTSLQSNQPRQQRQDQPQNLDTSWTYRSLPRTIRY